MRSEPRAFFALDHGTATTSASIVARLGGRWRLLASVALPAGTPVEAILRLLLERLAAADPELATELDVDASALEAWPRVESRSRVSATLAVVAVTERALAGLVAPAVEAGWRVVAGSAESLDPLEMTRMLLDPAVGAVLAGAGEPPGADERSALGDLAVLTAAAAARRPELTIVLAGSIAEHADRFAGTPISEAVTGESQETPERTFLLTPAASAGEPPGRDLRSVLEGLRAAPDDTRHAIARATGSLADALDRRVEVVEVGMTGSLRAMATPGSGDTGAKVEVATIADAGIAAGGLDEAEIDRIVAWSTEAADRHRFRDRLHELRVTPWADADGDGALLRLAAARAALQRLVEATPRFGEGPAPDVLVASGGAWAVAPGPAIALALVDLVRRPGVTQIAFDHARLLGPLGSIEDERERRQLLRDLADDLLVPLASVVMPQGMRAGRSAGRLTLRTADATAELELVPGGIELVDLPPGQTGLAELDFRDQVRLGGRGRRFEVDVAGGLGGLIVDLRDVPLRLPERQERRRELLAAWQRALWAGLDA